MEGKEEKPDKKGLHIEVDGMVEKRHKNFPIFSTCKRAKIKTYTFSE